ncbi:hypothetical protein CANCADRAFT_18620, partial [Tortispora caseinolytica NRRL Y-17796]
RPHKIFMIPEIMYQIFMMLDESNYIPHEAPPARRRPLSFEHALLIYNNFDKAKEVWEAAKREERENMQIKQGTRKRMGAGLFNCMLVSKTWHLAASRVLYSRIHFADNSTWQLFLESVILRREIRSSTENRLTNDTKPTVFVLHKVKDARQEELEVIASLGGRIRWLEFYTCPRLTPTRALLRGGRITKLVLPGCSQIEDTVLSMISKECPLLEVLDLRACELVSDIGLIAIAKRCRRLKMLNVGRTSGSHRITRRGVSAITRRTAVDTLGLAGCAIDDRAIWEIALLRGSGIERLSLNYCEALTDASIPKVLMYMPNLTVLELRNCVKITNVRPIVEFKHYQQARRRYPLIEGCEEFERRMREEE